MPSGCTVALLVHVVILQRNKLGWVSTPWVSTSSEC